MLDSLDCDEAVKEYQKARRIALNRLARKEYTSKEILSDLQNRGVSAATANQVVEDLKSERMIQDERFLEMFIRSEGLKGKGAAWISRRLLEKGIKVSTQEILPFLEEALGLSEEECIRKFIDRKYPQAFENPKEAQKAVSGLMRRGFNYSKIQVVLGRLILK